MISNIERKNGQNDVRLHKKLKIKDSARTAVGIAAGAAVGASVYNAFSAAPRPLIRNSLKNLPAQDAFVAAFDKAFEKSGLGKKGIEVLDANPQNSAVFVEKMKNVFPKFLLKLVEKKPELDTALNKSLENMTGTIVKGKNAGYIHRGKFIVFNKEKLSIAGFHELGHALNANFGGLGKILQKSRTPFKLLSVAAFGTALFKPEKQDGAKPKNGLDKIGSFVKDNCGKIAFLGMAPLLAEEALASIKGIRAAKPFLDAKSLKQLKIFNAKAFLTYAGLAFGVGAGVSAASWVRDCIAGPAKNKN